MKRSIWAKRETSEIRILHRPKFAGRMYCTECGEPVRWVLPDEAMALIGSSLRDVFRRVESRDLHFVESDTGFLLICAKSLNGASAQPLELSYEIEKSLVAA